MQDLMKRITGELRYWGERKAAGVGPHEEKAFLGIERGAGGLEHWPPL
jgi:hypothetical protein